MSTMYCPQCGRGLDLESGDVRFCRYCGFSLADTKEAIQGYSVQKRTGFTVVAWSYALLLIVTLLLHGQYISLDTRWGYWLSAILIVVSASLFCSAALSAAKPALFSKFNWRRDGKPEHPGDKTKGLGSADQHARKLPSPKGEPVNSLIEQKRVKVKEPRSVTDATTKTLDDRSH